MADGQSKATVVVIIVAVAALVGVGLVFLLKGRSDSHASEQQATTPAATTQTQVVEAPAPSTVAEQTPTPEPRKPVAVEAPKVKPVVAPVVAAPAAAPIDVMAALAYREEFLPSGYKMAELNDGQANPGFVAQSRLAEVNTMLNVQVQASSAYRCTFVGAAPGDRIVYTVIAVTDGNQAVALRDAYVSRMSPSKMHITAFVVGNHTILVTSRGEDNISAGDELAAKLKGAVNYTD